MKFLFYFASNIETMRQFLTFLWHSWHELSIYSESWYCPLLYCICNFNKNHYLYGNNLCKRLFWLFYKKPQANTLLHILCTINWSWDPLHGRWSFSVGLNTVLSWVLSWCKAYEYSKIITFYCIYWCKCDFRETNIVSWLNSVLCSCKIFKQDFVFLCQHSKT